MLGYGHRGIDVLPWGTETKVLLKTYTLLSLSRAIVELVLGGYHVTTYMLCLLLFDNCLLNTNCLSNADCLSTVFDGVLWIGRVLILPLLCFCLYLGLYRAILGSAQGWDVRHYIVNVSLHRTTNGDSRRYVRTFYVR